MCGIFGYFDQGRQTIADSTLAKMGGLLIHRGPNDLGIHKDQGVALGNRRLSVIDISGGHQPFISENGDIVVIQNGEIFNHVELAAELATSEYPCKTHCDTEVLLRLYQRYGIDFVSRLNGMFAIAIYDKRIDALYLIRDRIGVKPLYVHLSDGRILFGSEIKTILSTGIRREIDSKALDSFLTYNFVPPPLTMFAGIQHLEPGFWLRIDRNDIRKQCWWDLANIKTVEKTEQEWISEFNELLEDSVRLRLRSDVPFGAFLSGGVDSSTVVGLMSNHMDQQVKTFSIGFYEEKYDESPYAQIAAERFFTDHTMEKVDPNMLDLWPLATWYCDQPHGDISFLPTYKVAQLAARDVTVVLTGDGADELFAGYDKYKHFFSDDVEALPTTDFEHSYFQNISLFDQEAKQIIYSEEHGKEARQHNAFDVIAPLFNKVAHMDRINQALYLDMMLLLPGNNLVKPDRMGMAVSLEARTPFLDYRMMELAFSMPGKLKLHDQETKYIYKKAVSGLIGEELSYRRKQMFTVPVGEWFRKNLAPFTEEVLLSERTKSRGLFSPVAMQNMLKDHQEGKSNFTREIRALIAVELWARIFLDQQELSAPTLSSLGISPELVSTGVSI